MVFIEDHGFARRRRGILDEEELGELLMWLATRPDAGKMKEPAVCESSDGLPRDAASGAARGSADELAALKRKVIK